MSNTATRTNSRAATCHSCGEHVPAEQGIYTMRAVFCAEPVTDGGQVEWDGETIAVQLVACPTARLQEAAMMIAGRRRRAAEDATPEAQARVAAAAAAKAEAIERRAEQEAAWAEQGLERCGRCGGEGGSSAWPGFTCFDCGGDGIVPVA